MRFRRYRELSESIREHLEEKTDDLMAEEGLSREEAERRARREFGNVTLIEERSREIWQWPKLEAALNDARYAARQLWRRPGFTLTVILTLALAIGANTAIFSIVNALLLKSLPYPHPERLGDVYAAGERRNIDGEQWELLRDNVPSVQAAVSALRTNGVNLQAGARVEYLHAARVSAHYFDVLAIQPLLGRNFTEHEDRGAILSYRLWRTTFEGDPNIVGRAVQLKREPYTVIGVLPENATTPFNADLYTLLLPDRTGEGASTNFRPILRLRDGASWRQADAEINRAWANSARVRRVPAAYSAVQLQKSETYTLRPQVLALMLAAGFILLIACANLAGLSLVRLMRRTGELATRMAIGASRWQILRQLWIENLLLALLGGAAAVGTGFAALRGLLLLLPEHFLPVAAVPLDGRVLGFTLFLALLTSILVGMLPALSTRSVDLRSSVPSRGVAGSGGIRIRQGLIAGEVALTVVLLAAAGLLIRTLVHLETLPPGFNPNGVLTAKASLDDARYHDPEAFRKLLRDGLTAMREIPGVSSAAVGLSLPYERALLNGMILADGPNAGREITADELYVTPGYFDTLRIPVVAGRVFTDADGPDANRVAIINQTFARKFFPGIDPVGRSLDSNLTIVGVVADTVLSSAAKLHEDSAPLTAEETFYVPAAQCIDSKMLAVVHSWYQPSWIVRTAGPAQGLTARMQRALAGVDPQLPFSGFYSMQDLMAATLATQRVEVALLAAMSGLALLLSAIGIFALVANLVVHRTREIGIRIALGSTVGEAMLQVAKTGAIASAAGLLAGLILCAGVLRVMRSELWGVGVYDLATLVLVLLTLAAVTLLAATIPTLRIARLDPASTLRD